MTAYEYLIQLKEKGLLPRAVGSVGNKGEISNSDVRRLLESSGVLINKKRPGWKDEIEFPINQLIFFPKGNAITLFSVQCDVCGLYRTECAIKHSEHQTKVNDFTFSLLKTVYEI